MNVLEWKNIGHSCTDQEAFFKQYRYVVCWHQTKMRWCGRIYVSEYVFENTIIDDNRGSIKDVYEEHAKNNRTFWEKLKAWLK